MSKTHAVTTRPRRGQLEDDYLSPSSPPSSRWHVLSACEREMCQPPAGGDIGSTEGTHHSGSWSTGSKKAWGGAVRKWMKQRDRKDAEAAPTPPRSPQPIWTKDVSPSQGHPDGSSIAEPSFPSSDECGASGDRSMARRRVAVREIKEKGVAESPRRGPEVSYTYHGASRDERGGK